MRPSSSRAWWIGESDRSKRADDLERTVGFWGERRELGRSGCKRLRAGARYPIARVEAEDGLGGAERRGTGGMRYCPASSSTDNSEKLEPEKVKDKPLCMASYKYL